MTEKCHYIRVKDIGRVLIPGCMAVAVSGRIEDCTCNAPLSSYEEIEKLKKENKKLKAEIKRLKSLLY